MSRAVRPGPIAACAALALACAGAGEPPASEPDFRICTEPRSPICTHEYLPVCATLESGAKKTYGNACTACADPKVVGHREGACE